MRPESGGSSSAMNVRRLGQERTSLSDMDGSEVMQNYGARSSHGSAFDHESEQSTMQDSLSWSPRRDIMPTQPLPIRGYEVINAKPEKSSLKKGRKNPSAFIEKEPRVRNGKALVESNVGRSSRKEKSTHNQQQGALTQALSREPSVRNGIAHNDESTDLNVDESSPSPSRASWGQRIRQFNTAELGSSRDSASNGSSNNNGIDDEASGKSRESEHREFERPNSNLCDPQPADIIAALEALAVKENEEENGDVDAVIVADPPLTSEWPAVSSTKESSFSRTNFVAKTPIQYTFEEPSTMLSESDSSRRLPDHGIVEEQPCNTSTTRESLSGLETSKNGSYLDSSIECKMELEASEEGTEEWNAQFLQRWKKVRHRARLQAVGVRGIWKFNSPGSRGRHRTPELLVNDLPASGEDDCMRRGSTSLPSKKGSYDNMTDGEKNGGDVDRSSEVKSAQQRQQVNREPSLATLLLGEVAEVC